MEAVFEACYTGPGGCEFAYLRTKILLVTHVDWGLDIEGLTSW